MASIAQGQITRLKRTLELIDQQKIREQNRLNTALDTRNRQQEHLEKITSIIADLDHKISLYEESIKGFESVSLSTKALIDEFLEPRMATSKNLPENTEDNHIVPMAPLGQIENLPY